MPIYYFIHEKQVNLEDRDNKGSTALHWACYSKSEVTLSYILSMKPDLEAKDEQGYTALHYAIKSVAEIQATRPVRALLLKGARRDAVGNKGEDCNYFIPTKIPQNLRNELFNMLKEPKYLECFMVKMPLKPLRQNHKTQILFISLFIVILFTQLFLVVPSKSLPTPTLFSD